MILEPRLNHGLRKSKEFLIPDDFGKNLLNQKVAKELLRHVLDHLDDPVITYGGLASKVSADLNPRNLDKPLGVISRICIENGLPPVSGIVVNKEIGLPGDGFYREFYSGSKMNEWQDIFEKCSADVKNCDLWEDLLAAI